MASFIYDSARKAFADGDIDLLVDDIRCILVDAADYTASQAADDFLDDIAAGARVAVSGAMTSKTTTAGVFDAADVTFSSVTGDESEALVLYKHTGTDGTSQLIAYIDNAAEFPITPNGGDISVAWSSGANKIFKL